MPLVRKRRAPAADDVSDEEPVPTQRRRVSPDSDGDAYPAADEGATQGENQLLNQMVKKLVRLALACEYARIPIRRTDISAKVLGSQGRQFKNVFNEAQVQLRTVFGMEMTELPSKENTTLQQRRAAAQRAEKATRTINAWVLTTTLPDKYRHYDIIPPPKVPTTTEESAYVAMYTFLITAILLAGGSLPEAKFERYLKRTNIDQTTPIGQSEKIIQRMINQSYIVRVKDPSSGEEVVDYRVGPRGRIEVGEEGAAGLVRAVYGGDTAAHDLERRLDRSLRLTQTRQQTQMAPPATQDGTGRGRGRPRMQEQEEDGEAEESDGE